MSNRVNRFHLVFAHSTTHDSSHVPTQLEHAAFAVHRPCCYCRSPHSIANWFRPIWFANRRIDVRHPLIVFPRRMWPALLPHPPIGYQFCPAALEHRMAHRWAAGQTRSVGSWLACPGYRHPHRWPRNSAPKRLAYDAAVDCAVNIWLNRGRSVIDIRSIPNSQALHKSIAVRNNKIKTKFSQPYLLALWKHVDIYYLSFHGINFIQNAPQIANILHNAAPNTCVRGYDVVAELLL